MVTSACTRNPALFRLFEDFIVFELKFLSLFSLPPPQQEIGMLLGSKSASSVVRPFNEYKSWLWTGCYQQSDESSSLYIVIIAKIYGHVVACNAALNYRYLFARCRWRNTWTETNDMLPSLPGAHLRTISSYKLDSANSYESEGQEAKWRSRALWLAATLRATFVWLGSTIRGQRRKEEDRRHKRSRSVGCWQLLSWLC